MEKWKNLFRHGMTEVTQAVNSTQNATYCVQNDISNEQAEKIDFALKFVDTLSELEAQLHASDDPKEIAHGAMKMACDFYQADWCGFLEVDLDLGLWTPYWWYNPAQKIRQCN